MTADHIHQLSIFPGADWTILIWPGACALDVDLSSCFMQPAVAGPTGTIRGPVHSPEDAVMAPVLPLSEIDGTGPVYTCAGISEVRVKNDRRGKIDGWND